MDSFEESAPPLAMQPILASACQLSDLSDGDLAEIFRHLPPFDRLLISEVCKRWYAISRIAWSDIAYLNLSPIPGQYITAVIKQCPNLRSVTASRKKFFANELQILASRNLQSLKLYNCRVNNIPAALPADPVTAVFSSNLQSARWDELVLDDVWLAFQAFTVFAAGVRFPLTFPTSLKRLLVSDVTLTNLFQPGRMGALTWRGMEQLSELECLAVQGSVAWGALASMASFAALQNLRELVIGLPRSQYVRPLLSLSQLEVLFLDEIPEAMNGDFVQLLTKHPALRILALTGFVAQEMDFPARVRYGNGYDSPPLPQLHIFVAFSASLEIRFPKFPSDAAKVYPISEPLPQFLEREDIKPIFEGVWIAKMVKEADRLGAGFYRNQFLLTTTFRSIDA